TGKEAIVLGDPAKLPYLHLVGPGAMNDWRPRPSGLRRPDQPKPVRLAPGETHTVRIFTLVGEGNECLFWLLPGDYTIAGSYRAAISPVPKGSKDYGDGFGHVWVRIAPLKVKVLPTKEAVVKVDDAREIPRPPPPGTVIVPRPDDGSLEVRYK